MFYLKALLKKNKIKICVLSKELNIRLSERFCLHSDFTLEELKKIKNYLVDKQIITSDFDIGKFLDFL